MRRGKLVFPMVTLMAAQSACGFEGSAMERIGCVPWTPFESGVAPCALELGEPVTVTLDVADGVYNTTTGVLKVGNSTLALPGELVSRAVGTLRVVNLRSLQISAGRKLTLEGSFAALVLVHGDATIAGAIDASAPATGTTAPGGESSRCLLPTSGIGVAGAPAGASDQGGTGGGGGAFAAGGGSGGQGANSGSSASGGSAGSDDVPLRGGCAGGKGGDNESTADGDQGGVPGGGGGAFGISAGGTITVGGTLLANGGPGRGASMVRGGGGGGGSGGAIALDGLRVTLATGAALCANGGGGGEGSSDLKDGNPAPAVTCSTTVATGGTGGTVTAGDGGNGGAGTQLAGAGGSNGSAQNTVEGGGGGGGGSVGKILLRARQASGLSNSATVTSPAARPLP